jgi:hypothetical protein
LNADFPREKRRWILRGRFLALRKTLLGKRNVSIDIQEEMPQGTF